MRLAYFQRINDLHCWQFRLASQGLSCLETMVQVLRRIDEGLQSTQDPSESYGGPHIFHYFSNETPNLKALLSNFLHSLQDATSRTSISPTAWSILPLCYAVLILFLIRATLQSALRSSGHGFRPAGEQIDQDPLFHKRSLCPLCHPGLLVLKKMSFSDALQTTTDIGLSEHFKSLQNILTPSFQPSQELIGQEPVGEESIGELVRQFIDIFPIPALPLMNHDMLR